jgi:putative membrane protein
MDSLDRIGRRRIAAGWLALLLGVAGCAPMAQLPDPPGFTDPEIVAVARAANQGEVETSRPAVQRAQSAAVRQFAERVVAEHAAANEALLALGIEPRESQVSQQIIQNARHTAHILEQHPAATYDRAYLDAQITLHQHTLTTLENYLVPASRSAPLRSFLQQTRAAVAAHLDEARRIRGAL